MAVPISSVRFEARLQADELELELLLEALYQFYGDDLRGYDRALLRTRLESFMGAHRQATISGLQGDVLRDPSLRDALLLALCSEPQTAFGRPGQLAALREIAAPLLRSYAAPKVWLPECTSPAQAYTIAILLSELDLPHKARIFATASSEPVLRQARQGIFALESLEEMEANYRAGGGERRFDTYWNGTDGVGRFADALCGDITWAHHSLASDYSFNEFQLIVCRRSLQGFGPQLRRRALNLFNESLVHFGVLVLDREVKFEQLPFSMNYKAIADGHGLYRRMR